jgi:hypothetical protein
MKDSKFIQQIIHTEFEDLFFFYSFKLKMLCANMQERVTHFSVFVMSFETGLKL